MRVSLSLRVLRARPAAVLLAATIAAIALAGGVGPGRPALAQETTAQASAPGGGCRTYPTSVVNTTVSPGATVTLTYSGTHDTATHQTTYSFKYSDKSGGSYSYVQVVKYPSTASFVDEVQVIPPRPHATTTTVTGGVSYVLTNQYDAQGRLTTATNEAAGTTITTTYTAWDATGRPTAGKNSVTGPLTITYDDATRTATTKSAGGTQAQSYDANGNPSMLVQTYGESVFKTTTSIKSTAQVCK
jgi:YD repeat-containing protein